MKASKLFFRAKNQAGLTLIELIASLAILALVIGGALSLYTSASNSQATTQTVSDLNSLRAGIKSLYVGQGTYSGASNDVLVASGKVPTTIVSGSGGSMTTSFGGAITVSGGAASFTISTTAVPKPVCIGLLSSATGWSSATVGGATVSLPATPVSAATACAAAPATVAMSST